MRLAQILVCTALFVPAFARADDDASVAQSTLAEMPVREVTVFKDGHAFVMHEGELAVNPDGSVVLDQLPTPVLGTFWPYSVDPNAKLVSVTAGKRPVSIERTALDVRCLLEANPGVKVTIQEGHASYTATLVGIPRRTSEELAATSPPGADPQVTVKATVILLETTTGTRVVPIDRITDVTFHERPNQKCVEQEFRNILTLKFAFAEGKRPERVRVGMAYVQRGIRWIPNYRVTLDGQGKAVVELQATLLNELTNLTGVKTNLVIGVPSFSFKDMVDPISLQQQMAQLSPYFQQGSNQAYMLSNGMMTQVAGNYGGAPQPPQAVLDLGPAVDDGRSHEDLFVFDIDGVSLRKGERQVLPVARYSLNYRDVYALDLPFAPPPELQQQYNNPQQQQELAKMFYAPKVMHKLRLVNKSDYPLTTAPALILRDRQVVAQGMMTYTARGATTDLPVTVAADVSVSRSDVESKRTPDAAKFNGSSFTRVDLEGSIHLVNFRRQPIELEVSRQILGTLSDVSHEGKKAQLGAYDSQLDRSSLPNWWGWYNWPWWWRNFNGLGRAHWTVRLDAGKSVDLGYQWHYFWQ